MFRFKARIARNSELLRRFATSKLDILNARYEFMNKSEAPLIVFDIFNAREPDQALLAPDTNEANTLCVAAHH